MSFNLCECMWDCSHTLPIKKYTIFEIIEDLGIRFLTYGNASGGKYSSAYRSFLVNFQGDNHIVSFSIATYGTYAKPDIEKTTLNIAIDTDKSQHHALQLVLYDNLVQDGHEFKFFHHGRIAIGNIGSGKIRELYAYVEKMYPQILHKERFYLGTLRNTKLLYLDDEDVTDLFENLISYALIRDEYRKEIKSRL